MPKAKPAGERSATEKRSGFREFRCRCWHLGAAYIRDGLIWRALDQLQMVGSRKLSAVNDQTRDRALAKGWCSEEEAEVAAVEAETIRSNLLGARHPRLMRRPMVRPPEGPLSASPEAT